jgi:hypothetical protein
LARIISLACDLSQCCSSRVEGFIPVGLKLTISLFCTISTGLVPHLRLGITLTFLPRYEMVFLGRKLLVGEAGKSLQYLARLRNIHFVLERK